MIKLQKKNLKKLLKLITFYPTLNANKTMIVLVTQHLKMEEEEVVLVTSIFLVISQIFLKIFLEKDLVEEQEEIEDQIIEGQT